MNKFDEVYNRIVQSIEYRDISQLNKHGSIPQMEVNVLYQDCAFHRLPRKFTDELIQIIKQMKQKKEIEKSIDLRNYFKLIKKQQVQNFQEFFDFIQVLINSSEKNLTIKMGIENSYNQPIELIELSDKEYSKVFHDTPYKDHLSKKVKNQLYSNALKIMKQNVIGFNNLGQLIINPHTITDQMYEYDSDDNVIGHQIRHFLIFLQRWSKTNYEVCKRYSNQNIANYDRNNPDFKLYSLHQDQFITLSSTLIERLVNIFLKNKRSLKIQEVNQLIKSIFVKSGHYSIDILDNDLYWFKILNQNDPKIISIIQFYKNILDDKKYKIQAKSNKFDTLIGWTYNTFNEKIQQLKNKRMGYKK